jgi:hypothetical protein
MGLFSSQHRACPINLIFPADDLIEIKPDQFASEGSGLLWIAILDKDQNEGQNPSYGW